VRLQQVPYLTDNEEAISTFRLADQQDIIRKRSDVDSLVIGTGSQAQSSAASPVATHQGFDQLVGRPSTAPFD
jgi:hypothetical protein